MLKRGLTVLLIGGAFWLAAPPMASGVSKEILQILHRLETLQQMMQNMQRTLDSQTAVLRTLVEQANDNVNKMRGNVNELQRAVEQNLATTNARFDSMTGQIQALNESLEEAKARLAKLSEQVVQTQNIVQTLGAVGGTSTAKLEPGASGPSGGASPTVPDAESLYRSALSYYNSGQYDLAMQAFREYLQYYAQTALASNAQFYIGDCYYSQGNYARAVEEYNTCIERYPGGNKQPAAHLKKGYALLLMNQRQAGVRELRFLIQRFPNAREADLARQRLKQLGITVSAG